MIDFPKSYSPKDFEAARALSWEHDDCFSPRSSTTGEKFYIPLPPPNVTGNLHVGHSLMLTIQDIMIRYHRMKGDETLWLPGTDHAGISTQVRVESMLLKNGITRQQLGRKAFLDEVWKWKEEYALNINNQIRRMGASVDWKKERFTLDAAFSSNVEQCFVDLYKKGLIYRGEYMVNYSPKLESVISDAETERREETTSMYYLHYFVSGSDNELVVATTRPETLFGDVAIMVHPKDKRFKKMIGRNAIIPIINREIPIIADDSVDREFGTGAVKVTPAHDPIDFAVAKRHKLPLERIVIDKNGYMTSEAGMFVGQEAEVARENVVELLKARGNLIKIEPHIQQVSYCTKGNCRIQSIISTQWFVDSIKMAEPVMKGFRAEEFDIVPSRYSKIFEDWMGNLHDWCISRQLWWGHQIPAYYHAQTGELLGVTLDSTELEKQYGASNIVRDEDVLDTWFSSSLWPFAALDWNHSDPGEIFRRMYPANVLETGHDILLFWVIRMLLMGYHYTNETPFKTIYLNGLVLDEKGRKMSKSLDNVLNPLEVIDQYGTDALRLALVIGNTPGNNLHFSLKSVENYTLFLNKLWNIARFVSGKIGEGNWLSEEFLKSIDTDKLYPHDRAFLSRLTLIHSQVTLGMEEYNFSEVGNLLIQSLREDFADFYLEASKAYECDDTRKTILAYGLKTYLSLLHPYAPFITEELADRALGIKHLMITAWPKKIFSRDTHAEKEQEKLRKLVSEIRNIRTLKGVKPGEILEVVFRASAPDITFLQTHAIVLCFLAKITEIRSTETPMDSAKYSFGVIDGIELYVDTSSGLDVESEKNRLRLQIEDKKEYIRILDEKLLNKEFLKNAPEGLIRGQQEKKYQAEEQLVKLEEKYATLQ